METYSRYVYTTMDKVLLTLIVLGFLINFIPPKFERAMVAIVRAWLEK